ncbi:MAG TPA: hypothetical protein PKI32_04660, partial [Opitutales bacterium]|nr:hypothetical protein [Opitutales bacterium]
MKKVFSAAALAVLMWVALAADAPRPNAKRVREIAGYLADEPGFPDTRITNRAVWDRLAGGPGAYYVEKAAGIAKEPVPFLDDATYTNIVWGGVSAKRTRNLNALVYGECLENKGRFLGRIIEYLDAMCAQTTWMNPYHDRPNFGNFHGKYRSVDLNTGESAIDIAMALDCLKGKLPEKTVKRALDALAEFVFTPYLIAAADPNAIHNCCSWFFCDSNWNCACHNQVVSAALRTVADKWKRAKFVEGAERGYPFFLAGFSKEGYCQEGIDYWNYGYGEFLRLGLTVRKATADKGDCFAHPKARKCFDYAHDFQLVKWCSPQFGDGNAAPSDNNFAMGEIVWPETRSDFTRSCMPVSYGLEDCILKIFRPGALDPKPPAPTFRLPIRTFFADAQVFLCRPFDSGLYTLSACIKGGHNGVPHNHNDAGAYVIALGGTQMVEDPANQKYDLDTFGPKRYESKMRNSYGH